MGKTPNSTVYLFVNKDIDSSSLSRCHGRDASAILSHVQSCRNQRNKQLHLFRVETTSSPSLRERNRRSPSSPTSSETGYTRQRPQGHSRRDQIVEHDSFSDPTDDASECVLSRCSTASTSQNGEGSGYVPTEDDLASYFGTFRLSAASPKFAAQSLEQDLYSHIASLEEFQQPCWHMVYGSRKHALLACTAAKMAFDAPVNRTVMMLKATEYLQPSLQNLREQLADLRVKTMSDRQVLQEMLLYAVTSWYLGNLDTAWTHLNAMNCFIGCLDMARPRDKKFMEIINRCGLYVAGAQQAMQDLSSGLSYGGRRHSTA
jgi:hypothetical protein